MATKSPDSNKCQLGRAQVEQSRRQTRNAFGMDFQTLAHTKATRLKHVIFRAVAFSRGGIVSIKILRMKPRTTLMSEIGDSLLP